MSIIAETGGGRSSTADSCHDRPFFLRLRHAGGIVPAWGVTARFLASGGSSACTTAALTIAHTCLTHVAAPRCKVILHCMLFPSASCFFSPEATLLPGVSAPERRHYGSASMGREILHSGGQAGSAGRGRDGDRVKYLDAAEAYDSVLDTSRKLPPLPGGGRSRFACCSGDGRLYVLGGVGANGGAVLSCSVYDNREGAWHAAAPLPRAGWGPTPSGAGAGWCWWGEGKTPGKLPPPAVRGSPRPPPQPLGAPPPLPLPR